MIMKIFLFDDNKSINTYIVRIRIVEHISTLWKETLSESLFSFLKNSQKFTNSGTTPPIINLYK